MPTIGFLGADRSVWAPWTAAFVKRLGELGWTEGHTIGVEYRWGEGHPERYAEFAAEFIRLKVDGIVTSGIAVAAIKRATSAIPIVFAVSQDPVGGGLVASLAHPGGNVTGLSIESTDIASKRLELLREVVPNLRRLGILGNVGYPQAKLEMDVVQEAARSLGLEVAQLEIRRAEDIRPAFAALVSPVDALDVVSNSLIGANRTRIITLALGARLPTIFNTRDFVQVGGLMSYGANFPTMFRRTAELVDKILHGTRPGDIPVEQATQFDLVVNLTTAQAIGLKIPEAFLTRADEVIE